MKIVQTFWTLPSTRQADNIIQNRFCGGWLSLKYYYCSIAYQDNRIKIIQCELGSQREPS